MNKPNAINRDAVMMGVYLVVIALGVMMAEREPVLGMIQVLVGAVFFVLRLHLLLKRR